MVNRLVIEAASETLSTLEVTKKVVELERGNGSSLSSLYVNAIRAQAGGENPFYSRLQVRPRISKDHGPPADVKSNRLARLRCSPSPAAVSFSLQ